MVKKIADLINVKTLVTLAATGVFCYLAIVGNIKPEVFMSAYAMIIGYYFGTQHEKKQKGE